MKKKILIYSLLFLSLLGINQVLYLTKVQYVCTSKIDKGEELNLYETLSALETHSMLWLLGWIVEPNTAQICFAKQFHLKIRIGCFLFHKIAKLRMLRNYF